MKEKDWHGRAFSTAWGWAAVLCNRKGELVRLLLPSTREKAERAVAKFPSGTCEKIEAAIQDYFEGKKTDLSHLPVSIGTVSPFYARVYRALLKVPYGKCVSYKELAAMAGNPKAARAVGSAMRANRIPLVVPCHRVVPSGGGVGRFTAEGGAAMKRRLLELEAGKSSCLSYERPPQSRIGAGRVTAPRSRVLRGSDGSSGRTGLG